MCSQTTVDICFTNDIALHTAVPLQSCQWLQQQAKVQLATQAKAAAAASDAAGVEEDEGSRVEDDAVVVTDAGFLTRCTMILLEPDEEEAYKGADTGGGGRLEEAGVRFGTGPTGPGVGMEGNTVGILRWVRESKLGMPGLYLLWAQQDLWRVEKAALERSGWAQQNPGWVGE